VDAVTGRLCSGEGEAGLDVGGEVRRRETVCGNGGGGMGAEGRQWWFERMAARPEMDGVLHLCRRSEDWSERETI